MGVDYISREAVIIEAGNVPPKDRTYRKYGDIVRAIPAADVAPVRHGRWKPVGSITPMYECDQCHTITLGGKFCPNCGAKMEGGADA